MGANFTQDNDVVYDVKRHSIVPVYPHFPDVSTAHLLCVQTRMAKVNRHITKQAVNLLTSCWMELDVRLRKDFVRLILIDESANL